jgi:hypothetical protein
MVKSVLHHFPSQPQKTQILQDPFGLYESIVLAVLPNTYTQTPSGESLFGTDTNGWNAQAVRDAFVPLGQTPTSIQAAMINFAINNYTPVLAQNYAPGLEAVGVLSG